jgi:hypothetical protein
VRIFVIEFSQERVSTNTLTTDGKEYTLFIIKVMTKKNSKTTAKFRKNAKGTRVAKEIIENGEFFGSAIIGMMSIFAIDVKGMGIAAVGLAKALAALKDVGKVSGIEIDGIYDHELEHYEKFFSEISDENLL